MVVFGGQKFLTHSSTNEVLNHRLSALSWDIFHGFLDLCKDVCMYFYLLSIFLRKYKSNEEYMLLHYKKNLYIK